MKYIWSLGLMMICMSWFGAAVSAEGADVEPALSKNLAGIETNAFNDQELIVKFSSNLSKIERNSVLKSVNATEDTHLEHGDFSFVKVPKGTDLTKMAQILLGKKQIIWAEPNYKVKSTYIPQEPNFQKQWYLNKIQMPKAWDITKGSPHITVAVIDDGVQQDHPELKGKIVSPYNAVTGGTRYTPHEHSTHVAGIIAASFNNSGIAGIAPNVKIMPINVFNGDEASDYAVALGIKYAVDHHADVINMSLGSPYYSSLLDYYTNYAKSKGVILVAAAGNDGTFTKTYPAAFKAVVGVGATNSFDHRAIYSNKGSFIDFTAPGSNIYSSINGGSYAYLSGTSMAAPVVSGVAALVLSKNPFLSPKQVENILRHSTIDLGPKGRDDYYGYGRIDAYKAMSNTPSSTATINTPKTYTMTGKNKAAFSLKLPGEVKLTISIKDSSGKTVNTILNNKIASGKVSAYWDGKSVNKKFVHSGTYKVVIKAANNRASISKIEIMKVVNHTYAAILVSGEYPFSPKVSKAIKIPYQLTQKAKVSANVTDQSGKIIKNIMINKPLAAGKYSIAWDGKNTKGQSVKDSTYKLNLSLIDTYNKKGKTKSVPIRVDTVRPSGKIVLSSNIFNMDTKSRNTMNLQMMETAKVRVLVTNEKGTTIKELSIKQFKSATVNWNGQDAKKQFATEGRYRYLVQMKDLAGNSSTIQSEWFDLKDRRVPTIQSEKDVYSTLQELKPVDYTLSKTGNVSIEVTQGGTLIKSIKNNLVENPGDQSFLWDGTNNDNNLMDTGDYQFKISIEDKYGLQQYFTGNIHIN
ncbi:S8 family serine peptidase [Bacillus salipaludis]|uniref:S8 family serine peptidase n=1 Tax=Bacillus salipaludis TaxID=2547811 RepID=A0AA90QXK6_9BACI|nr:S8 family serine peptidase [Bacillus salipaludis]MDQ6600377.1 S8 family serine peptidase [Bacillus salipaludis]